MRGARKSADTTNVVALICLHPDSDDCGSYQLLLKVLMFFVPMIIGALVYGCMPLSGKIEECANAPERSQCLQCCGTCCAPSCCICSICTSLIMCFLFLRGLSRDYSKTFVDDRHEAVNLCFSGYLTSQFTQLLQILLKHKGWHPLVVLRSRLGKYGSYVNGTVTWAEARQSPTPTLEILNRQYIMTHRKSNYVEVGLPCSSFMWTEGTLEKTQRIVDGQSVGEEAAVQSNVMQVQVPEGAPAGTSIQVQAPNGQTLQVQVPPGMPAGSIMSVLY